jgi:hypothetical protein
MIVASLLLILVAVTLLVLGLTGGSSTLLISSIVASLLAAVALVVGARHHAGARRTAADQAAPTMPPGFTPEAEFAAEPFEAPPDRRDTVQFETQSMAPPSDSDVDEPYETASGAVRDEDEPVGGSTGQPDHERPDYERAADAINAARSEHPDENAWRHAETTGMADEFAEPDEDDPADEPLPQAVRPADAVRVARMDAEVLVVDGRPRYHLPDCSHLVGRLTEPIPVNEAVELGFSPCGLCRPVDRLVAAAARH